MSKTEHDLPSYESTLQNSHNTTSVPNSSGQQTPYSLQSQLTTSRTNHINDVVSAYILPCIYQRASIGLSQTTIVLLPWIPEPTSPNATKSERMEDDILLDTTTRIIDIVSSHTEPGEDEELQRVQLSDPMDSVTFWSQARVLDELRTALDQRLRSSLDAQQSEKPSDPLSTRSVEQTQIQSQSQARPSTKVRGFFARKMSSSATNQAKAERANLSDRTRSGSGSLAVNVLLDEVCMRTQSSFGLFETLMKPAVVVKINMEKR